MKNTIIIKGLKIFAYHGVHDEEKVNGQEFIIDVYLGVEKLKGFVSDKIEDTVNYSEVAKFLKKKFISESRNLLESIGEKVIKDIFDNFADVEEVRILIKKPNAPIKDIEFEYVGVEIFRERKDYID